MVSVVHNKTVPARVLWLLNEICMRDVLYANGLSALCCCTERSLGAPKYFHVDSGLHAAIAPTLRNDTKINMNTCSGDAIMTS